MEHANIQMDGWIYIQVCISEEGFRLQRAKNREGVMLYKASLGGYGDIFGVQSAGLEIDRPG